MEQSAAGWAVLAASIWYCRRGAEKEFIGAARPTAAGLSLSWAMERNRNSRNCKVLHSSYIHEDHRNPPPHHTYHPPQNNETKIPHP